MLKKVIKYQTSEKNSRKIGCFQDIVFSEYFYYTYRVLRGCQELLHILGRTVFKFETIAPLSDVSHNKSSAAGNFLRI